TQLLEEARKILNDLDNLSHFERKNDIVVVSEEKRSSLSESYRTTLIEELKLILKKLEGMRESLQE
ncbi:MAG TPA: hypothetical protein VLK33_00845, partial [Terriglobales bacterium]|nr:hypothetical protein [Terriglobales bacterium]